MCTFAHTGDIVAAITDFAVCKLRCYAVACCSKSAVL
jgi:hypothetical protein